MKRLEVFEPAMCCTTGVCGPSVDPVLVQFASDLNWLQARGVEVSRYNLLHQTAAFADNPDVMNVLGKEGQQYLPVFVVDGKILHKGSYPDRRELASLVGIIIL